MLYIISGEDQVSSRNKLVELIGGKKDVIRIEGKKASISDIEMALESNSLFAEQKIIVIEQFGKVKPQDKLTELVSKFVKDKNTDVILWDETEPSAKISNSLQSAQIFTFSFPKLFYSFLDNFSPGTLDKSITILAAVLKTNSAEQIFYSLVKRARLLMIFKTEEYKNYSDIKRMQGWQVSKLVRQSNLWSIDQLQKVFLKLAQIDEEMKTGNLLIPLPKRLDILLLSDLN